MARTSNRFRTIKSQAELLELWPFFLEGLEAMNDFRGCNTEEPPERYFKMMSWIVSNSSGGGVAVFETSRGKPLGFVAGFNNTPRFGRQKVLFVYAIYTNSLCPTSIQDMAEFSESWAKQNGYQIMEGANGRFSGATFRWYERKLGWKRHKLIFRREIQ